MNKSKQSGGLSRLVYGEKAVIDAACVSMFVHILCGLIRFLSASGVIIALDFAAFVFVLSVAAANLIKYKPKLTCLLSLCKEHCAILFVFVWCMVSTLINIILHGSKSAFYSPNALMDTAMLALVFFPFGIYAAKNGIPPLGRSLLKTMVALWSLFMGYVLVYVFMGKLVTLPNGIQLGMPGNLQSLRLNNNPNSTSCIESVFFIVCAVMAFDSKGIWRRAIYIMFALIHFAGLALSDSRTYFLTTSFLSAVMSFALTFRFFGRRKPLIRIFFSLFAACLTVAALFGLRHLTFEAHALLRRTPAASDAAKSVTVSTGEKSMDASNFATFSNRTSFWSASLDAIVNGIDRFLFGYGVANSHAVMTQAIGSVNLYTHNQFLELAVCAGVPAAAGFALFILFIFFGGAQLLIKRKASLADLFALMYFLALLIANQMEAHLFFYRRPTEYAFFLVSGWLCGKRLLQKSVKPSN